MERKTLQEVKEVTLVEPYGTVRMATYKTNPIYMVRLPLWASEYINALGFECLRVEFHTGLRAYISLKKPPPGYFCLRPSLERPYFLQFNVADAGKGVWAYLRSE